MRCFRLLPVALLAAAVGPAAAAADAPWSEPATIPGASGYDAELVFTLAGRGVLATTDASATNGQGTLLAPVGTDGRPGSGRRVRITGGLVAAYAKDHVLLAGTTPATTGAEADVARVEVAVGTPAGGVGTPRALPQTTRQQLLAVAGGPDGTAALVTGSYTGHRERVVWIRRGGVTRRALTIRVGERARGAAVAVDSHGDVLVVYEDDHAIFSRHLGRTGRAAPAHRLGAGVQSLIQARFAESGRQEVAWISQRVSEGDAASPAVVSYTSAARGRGFTAARVVGRSNVTGAGRYVQGPGVRLVGSGSDSSILALTVHDGSRYRVRVADVVAGSVEAAQTVSPDGEDDVLGALAYARAGGTVVLWRTGTRGADASGPQRVVARVRPPGAVAFGPSEGVSPPVDSSSSQARDAATVPYAPGAAIDPVTGTALAAFGFLAPGVALSARPAGRESGPRL